MTDDRPKLGLALGSGAARGVAHLGVLRALEETGVKPDVIAGTSIGALVGGVYAAGKLDELTEVALGLDWKQVARYLMEVGFPRSGLIEGSRVTALLTEIVGERLLTELPIPFRAVATDIMSGEEVVIEDGPLVAAIRASISIPGIFTPARRNEELLVDGGLTNPVPVSVCRAMGAERVIAVDLNYRRVKDTRKRKLPESANDALADRPAGIVAKQVLDWLDRNTGTFDTGFLDPVKAWMERPSMPNIFDILGNTVCIIEAQIAASRLQVDRPDLLIQPDVSRVHFLEFFLAEEMIEEGYRATKEALAGWGEKNVPR